MAKRRDGRQDARCASAEARHLQRELEDLRDENARLEKQVVTLGELLKSTAEARDRLLRERMEIDLRAEAQQRCDASLLRDMAHERATRKLREAWDRTVAPAFVRKEEKP